MKFFDANTGLDEMLATLKDIGNTIVWIIDQLHEMTPPKWLTDITYIASGQKYNDTQIADRSKDPTVFGSPASLADDAAGGAQANPYSPALALHGGINITIQGNASQDTAHATAAAVRQELDRAAAKLRRH